MHSMRSRTTTAAAIPLAMAVLIALSFVPSSADTYRIAFAGEPREDRVKTIDVGGATYLRLSDLARAFGGARHWNPKTQKLTLVTDTRRITMAEESAIVAIGQDVVNVGRPVVRKAGAYWVPRSFLTRALAPATNSEIEIDASEGTMTVTRLGARVTSVTIGERGRGTVVILGLGDRAEFSARNVQRGVIEVVLPGAVLSDTLAIPEGAGLVSSVELKELENGVDVAINVRTAAKSYSAEFRRNPYRVEIVIEPGGASEIPSPALREPKSLLPSGGGAFADAGSGVTTVMIDPGGGGRATGGVGRAGLLGKDANLALARELQAVLRDEGFYVFMTRTSDSDVMPKRRAEIANLAGADVFVSIQCGAWFSSAAGGFRVLYYRLPKSYATPASGGAERGGLRRNRRGDRPEAARALLWNRVQEDHLAESRSLARAVHGRMEAALPIPDRGIRRVGLSVLAGCAMPAIQVEASYITNRDGEALLADRTFLRDAARAIARGIIDYRSSSDRG